VLTMLAFAEGGSVLASSLIGIASFVMVGAFTDIAERTSLFRAPITLTWARAKGLSRSTWGTAFAHCGLGLTLIGIVFETHWGMELITTVKTGQTLSLSGYELAFNGLQSRNGPNYQELAGRFVVRKDGVEMGVMSPSKRSFPARETTTTEAALKTR